MKKRKREKLVSPPNNALPRRMDLNGRLFWQKHEVVRERWLNEQESRLLTGAEFGWLLDVVHEVRNNSNCVQNVARSSMG